HLPPGRDQGIFATAGLMVSEGRVLYRDIFEVKQPLLLFAYAGVLRLADAAGAAAFHVEAINLLDQLVRALAIPLLYVLGARLFGRPTGLATAALFGVMGLALYGGFWNVAQAESFAGPLTALAFLAALRGRDREGWGWWGLAGAAAAAAALFKATALVPALVVALMALGLGSSGPASRRLVIRRLATGLAGGILVALPLLGYFLAHGALGDLLDVQVGFNRFHGWRQPLADIARIQAAVFVLPWWCEPRGLIQTAAAAAALVLAVRGPWPVRWLAVWYGLAWVTVPLQGKLWDYHYALLLPPQALLTAWCVRVLVGRAAWRGWRALPAAALAAVLALQLTGLAERYGADVGDDVARLTGRLGAGEYVALSRFQIEGRQIYRSRDLREAAAALRERAARGNRLMVFGLDQTLNFLSGLLPTTRYLYSYPLVLEIAGYGPERERRRREFLAAIQKRPPRFLVVPDGPIDEVTGRSPARQIEEFESFCAWALARYAPWRKIGAYAVFEHTDSGRAGEDREDR
ncbi:MAG: glycosyltransferase family 39 protein, partial [Planctomycetes bacterium]|nr:glycosyltransferase family 39 protein [Planctomycetota bacterium]